jgi:NapC/NirT cytochrome c family, N-terminal region
MATDSGMQKRPILIMLTSHWVTMAGVTLVTLAGFSWLFVLPQQLNGRVGNPYVGLLLFGAIPAVFFAGLALIPVGLALARRSVAAHLAGLPDPKSAWRKAGIFFAVMTCANLVIGSQLSYRAVEHMDTSQFCGQTCHVMQPEFTAHMQPPHQAVECASCHIVAGPAGWLHAKMNGMNQLLGVVLNNYPRPIESALESNKLVSSADTCEQCHAREKVIGPRLKVIPKFKDDEANTPIETVLLMLVGGGSGGGIHGAHMGPGVRIRYAAADKKRQTIPWVEYENTESHEKRDYALASLKPETLSGLPTFEMQCVDCHNRAAHSFQTAEAAVNQAMAAGRISTSLPFVKKTGMALLQTAYASHDEAAKKIQAGLSEFYQKNYGDIWARQSNEVQQAAEALAVIYNRNVFPDLKVTWGTYPNNLGHMDDPGCFRCHDESHVTKDKRTIPQDCGACHDLLADEESAPAILKTLGLDAGTQKGNP